MSTEWYRDKTMHCLLLGIVSIFAFPAYATAQVVISEIAWMGDARAENGSYCEWVELFNSGTEAVSVSEWTLSFNTTNVLITGNVSIPAGGFFVIERYTENACPDPVLGVSDFGGSFGNGLPNGGATLILKDASDAEVDKVTGGENWSIGGSNETKQTAQRTVSGVWVTGSPTPAGATVASASTTGGTGTTTITTTARTQTTSSGRSGGGRVVVRSTTPKVRIEPEPLALSINAPTIAYVNQTISFEVESEGPGKTILNSLEHTWSFGDTFTGTGKTPTHRFMYPGEYTVVVESQYAKQIAQARHEISILPASLTLSRGQKGEVVIKNLSAHEIDLGGFTLQSDVGFVFPRFTIIKQGGTLTVPPARVRGQGITLLDTHRTIVASLEETVTTHTSQSAMLARIVSTQGSQATVATKNVVTTTADQPSLIPSGVIRIGNDAEVSSHSRVGSFLARLARVLGF